MHILADAAEINLGQYEHNLCTINRKILCIDCFVCIKTTKQCGIENGGLGVALTSGRGYI